MQADELLSLTVIVACFNSAATLARQLEALARQAADASWELIVADNGSRDGTRALVDRFRHRFERLTFLDAARKRGAAYARNSALQRARGACFAFCDADDEVAPGWVSAMSRALGRHAFVYSRLDDRKLNDEWLRELWRPADEEGSEPLILGFLPGAATFGMGFTRALYERVGPFDESLQRMSDIDYAWRAQLAGYRLHRVDDAVVHYRHRASLAGLYRQAYRDGQAQVLLYKKYAAHGCRWPSFRRSAAEWVGVARSVPALRSPLGRGRVATSLGFKMGHVRGSLRYGVMAL